MLLVIAAGIIGTYEVLNAVQGITDVAIGDESVVEGTIRIKATGLSVDGAKGVLNNSRTEFTDDSSSFSFEDVRTGNHEIHVVSADSQILFTRAFDVGGGETTKALGEILLDEDPRLS